MKRHEPAPVRPPARTRRDFLKGTLAACTACAAGCGRAVSAEGGEGGGDTAAAEESAPGDFAAPARFWEPRPELRVRCTLCPRECEVADRERGYCGVRENRGGEYFTLVHSRVCAENIDPVEKKPLFHFLPGSRAYSIATAGCNMECRFCQNWEISQFRPEQIPARRRTPAEVARIARRNGCPVVAYTYSEPVVFAEYVADCAAACREAGARSVMISNGYINAKPLKALLPVLDAVKIDLKAFTDDFYRRLCSGELAPVLSTLEVLKGYGIWFEIVVLLVPTHNDSRDEIRRMCGWIVEKLGASVPVHFTRFHPVYKLRDLPRTPMRSLEAGLEAARSEGVRFAYLGNVPGHAAENTACPACGEVLIRRTGTWLAENRIEKGCCTACGAAIPGIWTT